VRGSCPKSFPQLMPADTFYLAAEYQQRFPQEPNSFGPPVMNSQHSVSAIRRALAGAFGRETLESTSRIDAELRARTTECPPLPVFMGYANRLFAETWDSTPVLGAPAVEKGYSPVIANRLVPELTRRMVEKIFCHGISRIGRRCCAPHEKPAKSFAG